MRFHLSNYEFRAYRKRTGRIWLHLRTHILFETNVSFSVDAYLRNINGTLALPDSRILCIDGFGLALACSHYDGQVMVHELSIAVPTDLTDLKPCVAVLSLTCDFNFHDAFQFQESHEHRVFIRRMYR